MKVSNARQLFFEDAQNGELQGLLNCTGFAGPNVRRILFDQRTTIGRGMVVAGLISAVRMIEGSNAFHFGITPAGRAALEKDDNRT